MEKGCLLSQRNQIKRLGFRYIFWIGIFTVLFACDQGMERQARDGQSVEIVFTGVALRQYHRKDERFSLSATTLVLDEQKRIIKALRGVRGRLESLLWE